MFFIFKSAVAPERVVISSIVKMPEPPFPATPVPFLVKSGHIAKNSRNRLTGSSCAVTEGAAPSSMAGALAAGARSTSDALAVRTASVIALADDLLDAFAVVKVSSTHERPDVRFIALLILLQGEVPFFLREASNVINCFRKLW